MKKFLAVALLFLSFEIFAQVKNYVGIVREQYYPAHTEFLEKLRDYFKKEGYPDYAEYVDSYLKGGFGSGFVFVDSDGNNYIITNRHVVSQAASASIEFENSDGSVTKYNNLSVLITDDDIDIAILKFADDIKPFKNGLKFYSGTVSDGDDVVSAGFPGLGKEPVWQFGKGSITNSAARIKDLIEPSISTIIQHSAQIDAGNSGGPLLIASKQAETGYEVIGVNTWKAVGRDSTNFAIPGRLALTLLEGAKHPKDDSEVKQERREKFRLTILDSSEDWTSIVKFVSYEFASESGVDAFDEILKKAPKQVQNRVGAEFAVNPMEGLRYALAYKIYETFSGKNANQENLEKINWEKEHGLYRIFSYEQGKSLKGSFSSKKDLGEKKGVSFIGLESPYSFSFEIGRLSPDFTETDDGSQLEAEDGLVFDISVYPGDYFGVFLELEKAKISDYEFTCFGCGGEFRIPINFNVFCISPKVGAGMKVGFDDPQVLQFFFETGVELSIDFGFKYLCPVFSINYRQADNYLSSYSYENDLDVKVTSTAWVTKIGLAIKF